MPILGCTIAWVHNKVSTIELPGALSMYGGAKLTLVVGFARCHNIHR
jgi:PTS system arbutin-like IIC component